MGSNSPDKPLTLDNSIEECTAYIDENRRSSRKILLFMVLLVTVALYMLFVAFVFPFIFDTTHSNIDSSLKSSLATGVFVIVSIIIGVFVSMYRFHIQEIARTEHYKIGFLRIRVAANNTKPGFGSEVRKALTEGAFSFEGVKLGKASRVEGPLPGHPSSDISSALINKLLDAYEVSFTPKNGTKENE